MNTHLHSFGETSTIFGGKGFGLYSPSDCLKVIFGSAFLDAEAFLTGNGLTASCVLAAGASSDVDSSH